jgi:hypothetical protein
MTRPFRPGGGGWSRWRISSLSSSSSSSSSSICSNSSVPRHRRPDLKARQKLNLVDDQQRARRREGQVERLVADRGRHDQLVAAELLWKQADEFAVGAVEFARLEQRKREMLSVSGRDLTVVRNAESYKNTLRDVVLAVLRFEELLDGGLVDQAAGLEGADDQGSVVGDGRFHRGFPFIVGVVVAAFFREAGRFAAAAGGFALGRTAELAEAVPCPGKPTTTSPAAERRTTSAGLTCARTTCPCEASSPAIVSPSA